MSYDTFWHLNPTKLKAFETAYDLKRQEKDQDNWFLGQYIRLAMIDAMPFGDRKSVYPEEPFLRGAITEKYETEEEIRDREEAERLKRGEALLQQLNVMKINHELSQKGYLKKINKIIAILPLHDIIQIKGEVIL